MFRRGVDAIEVLALVAAAAFLLLLFANEPDAGGGRSATSGATLFAEHCARCHGSDGGDGIGPQLAGGAVVGKLTETAEIAVVTDGRGGMPAFGGALSGTEIRQVVEYTRTL